MKQFVGILVFVAIVGAGGLMWRSSSHPPVGESFSQQAPRGVRESGNIVGSWEDQVSTQSWLPGAWAATPTPGVTIRVRQGESIQKALQGLGASGGTVVVGPGEYRENITLPSGVRLRAEKSQTAVIIPRDTRKQTLMGWGVSRVWIEGFDIRGAVVFTQASTDFSRTVSDIVVRGNRISGSKDFNLIKFAQSARILIEQNEISDSDGRVGVDLVSVRDFSVRNNVISNIRGSNGFGVVAKGGSFSGTISGNKFSQTGNAAVACGQITGEDYILPDVKKLQFEARKITISNNDVGARDRFALLVQAGQDCHVLDNRVTPSQFYADIKVDISGDTHHPAWVSRGVVIDQPGLNSARIDISDLGADVVLNGKKVSKK